jgi:hypothetical protein
MGFKVLNKVMIMKIPEFITAISTLSNIPWLGDILTQTGL